MDGTPTEEKACQGVTLAEAELHREKTTGAERLQRFWNKAAVHV